MNSEDKINLVSLDEIKDETFDACIIGTGAGGAVVGYHLANSGFKVLMLEKGGYYPHEVIADKKTKEEDLLKLWKNRGAQVTNLPPIAISQGECVGGSTIINYGMCLKCLLRLFLSGKKNTKSNFQRKTWMMNTKK